MDISNFFKGMLPQFSRARLQEDLRAARDEYATIVMPSLSLADKNVKSFKSETARNLAKSYSAIGGGGSSLFGDIEKHFAKLNAIYAPLEEEIANEFGERIVPSALSARTANVVRLVNVLAFLNRYSMSLVNVIAHFECKEAGLAMELISDVTPGEVDRMNRLMVDFAQLLKALSKVGDVKEALSQIPEVQIENKDVTRAFAGKIDPFGVFRSGMGFRGSPAYWLSMVYAEYQHDRYKMLEAQKRSLEKRILALKRIGSGNPSAQAEEELEVLSSNVARLSDKIREYEGKNA